MSSKDYLLVLHLFPCLYKVWISKIMCELTKSPITLDTFIQLWAITIIKNQHIHFCFIFFQIRQNLEQKAHKNNSLILFSNFFLTLRKTLIFFSLVIKYYRAIGVDISKSILILLKLIHNLINITHNWIMLPFNTCAYWFGQH